jgi:hypothetical protein
MSKTLMACVEDFFFRSKIEATARHLNVPVRFVSASELAKATGDGGAGAVLLELSAPDALAAVKALRRAKATESLAVIGFLSHVDHKLAEEAQSAGVTRPAAQPVLRDPADLVMDCWRPEPSARRRRARAAG